MSWNQKRFAPPGFGCWGKGQRAVLWIKRVIKHSIKVSNTCWLSPTCKKRVRKALWNFVVNFQFNQSFSMESFHWKPTCRLSPRFWVELVKIKMRGASFGTRLWRCLLKPPTIISYFQLLTHYRLAFKGGWQIKSFWGFWLWGPFPPPLYSFFSQN